MSKNWQEEAIQLAVLVAIAERSKQMDLVTDDFPEKLLEPTLVQMTISGLLDMNTDTGTYVVSDKGRQVLRSVVEFVDHLWKFEIFHAVNIGVLIPDGQQMPDDEAEEGVDPWLIQDHLLDPRFAEGPDAIDMRLTMMTFIAEWREEPIERFDPHRVVFIQKLARTKMDDVFWGNLLSRRMFREIEGIVATAKLWQSLGDDEEDSAFIAGKFYTAGTLEDMKRNGVECSRCGAQLGVFEQIARNEGGELIECPNPACRADFRPPEPPAAEYECPACHSDIFAGQSRCRGCGARVNFSLPEGTVHTETTETVTETTSSLWDDGLSWGYEPYGYYHPYDPWGNTNDVLFNALLLDALID